MIEKIYFKDLLLHINLVWSAPLQITIAMYFLWSILGPSILAGLAVILISMPITGVLLNVVSKIYTKQMDNKDERVKVMNEILNGIKVSLCEAYFLFGQDQFYRH